MLKVACTIKKNNALDFIKCNKCAFAQLSCENIFCFVGISILSRKCSTFNQTLAVMIAMRNLFAEML